MALAIPRTTAIWHEPPELTSQELAITDWPLLSAILQRRGIHSRADAERFLRPEAAPLGDPFLLPDMRHAVTLIQDALEANQPIGVFGDYDVDGISSTAMLTRVLRRLGGLVTPRIPHRVKEGYGLNLDAVDELADRGCRLLIAVDCGSSNVVEIERALDREMRVIVIDHHRVHHDLPGEVAFVSPKRPDNAYVEPELAAAGVAFTLVRALVGDEAAEMYLPYAALATVADVVPLRGENRVLAARGISLLRRWGLPGFKELCKLAGIDRRGIDAFDIGFVVGPRINAAGRMESPDIALNWFLSDDAASSRPHAQKLDRLNQQRRADTRAVLDQAELQLRLQDGGFDQPALVVDGQEWNAGVVGIVAGRLADRYNRPAVVIARGPRHSTGSARTAGAVDIVEAIRACRDLLERFGGHTAAAGMTLETAKIDAFRTALNSAVYDQLGGVMPVPEIFLDAAVDHADLTLATVDGLEALEPCGHGNDRPLFLVRGLQPQRVRTSRDGKHLLFDVADRSGNRHQAVFFNAGERSSELQSCGMIDSAMELRRNSWKGQVRLQLQLTDFRPANAS